jgi:hypothetical protein
MQTTPLFIILNELLNPVTELDRISSNNYKLANQQSMNPLIIISARKVGNTTRQVDAAIQELFNTGKVKIIDHAHEEDEISGCAMNEAQNHLLSKLFGRLSTEHNFTKHDIEYNAKTKILKLK